MSPIEWALGGVVVGWAVAQVIVEVVRARRLKRIWEGERDAVTTKVIRDIRKAPRGSVLVITYPGFFTPEQRRIIEARAKEKVGDDVRVLVLEGGIKATFG